MCGNIDGERGGAASCPVRPRADDLAGQVREVNDWLTVGVTPVTERGDRGGRGRSTPTQKPSTLLGGADQVQLDELRLILAVRIHELDEPLGVRR